MTTYPAPAPDYVGPAAHVMHDANGKPWTDNQPIHRIVIHGTVSPTKVGGARQIAAYFRSQSSGGSAHYVVDPGEAVQVVYDNEVAEHAPPNLNSLGVELCDPVAGPASRWQDADHQAMLAVAAELVAGLSLAYNVPAVKVGPKELVAGAHGICGHVDVSNAWHQTNHTDPGIGFPWAQFIGLVKEQIAAEVKRAATAKHKKTPAPAPKPTSHSTHLHPFSLAKLHTVGTWNVERGRPSAEVKADLREVVPLADVWMLQECQGYRAELEEIAPALGYTYVAFDNAPEQNESPLLVRNGLTIEHDRTDKITTSGWFTVRGGKTPPKWSTVARVEGIAFESVHAPVSVATAKQRVAAPRRWAAYRQMGTALEQQGLAHHAIIGGDWNISAPADKGTNRHLPQAVFCKLDMARRFPSSPTHGKNTYDYFGVRGLQVVNVRTAPVTTGSDHKPVLGDLKEL